MKTRHTLTALAVLALAGLAWAAAPVVADSHGGSHGGPHFGWEQFAERHDVDGDGRVTEQELFQTLNHFDRLDADGDGFVTEADFAAHRAEMAFTFLARRADADRDGNVTGAEWNAWFAFRDANDDGRLDENDFEGDRRGPGRGRHHAAFAEALDADGDGVVTQADLTALAARFDADGDGVVTSKELPEVGPHHGRFHHHGPGPGR